MKIEIWSDIACPFCYFGKRKLEAALSEFPHKDKVDIEFKSYQLDPDAELYSGQDFYETMAAKFGSVEKAKQMATHITQQAKAAGLYFHFETMKPTNTFDAHRLTKFAREFGKDTEVSEQLLKAHFTDSKDVGDIETLAAIAKHVGLDAANARTVLEDKQTYAPEVQADIDEAKQLGISGVPYFVVNRKYAISGAQPSETFTQALNKVWEEEQAKPAFETLSADNNADAACGEDGCTIPDNKV